MMLPLLLRLAGIALLIPLVVSAAQPTHLTGSSECQAASKASTPRSDGVDSVSLMQSRGIKVDLSDEGHKQDSEGHEAATAPAQVFNEPLAKVQVKSLIEEHDTVTLMSAWSFILTLLLLSGLCIGAFAFIGHLTAMRKEQDLLEGRVSSVLQQQQVASEEAKPPAGLPMASFNAPLMQSPMQLRQSPIMPSWLSPNVSATMPDSKEDLSGLPPPLSRANPPLPNEVRLLLPSQNLQAVRTGGEILLANEQGRPLVRACVRKVDDDYFLDVTVLKEAGGSHSLGAMVQLARKEPSHFSSWSGANVDGVHEIFSPDGNVYGSLQMRSTGGCLVLAHTSLPALIIDGDLKNLQMAVRLMNGIELANLSKADGGASRFSQQKQVLQIQRGNDLALIVASVLSVLLTS